MDRVFSVDEIADQFWSAHVPPIRLHEDADVEQASSCAAATSSSKMVGMNRSSSEWAFQQFLQEAASPDHNSITLQSDDVVEIKDKHHHYNGNQQPQLAAAGGPPLNISIDSEEYQAFLKSRLDLACAAVALTRATKSKASESESIAAAAASDIGSQASNSSQYKDNGRDSFKAQDKDPGGPVSVPLIHASSRKSSAQVKSTTSGSSGDQSDDDEAEGENESTQNMDPSDAKRMRRDEHQIQSANWMLSNRESARRSRRRKQAHLTELETQVSQLRVENSSLLERFTDISQKYNEAAVDNRVLKADVETLRAKVKMAEETVKRVTGLNPLFQAMSEISTMGLPSFATGHCNTSADVSLPIQQVNHPNKQHYFHAPSSNNNNNNNNNNHLTADHRIQNPPPAANVVQTKSTAAQLGANKVGRTTAYNLDHLQKPIRDGGSSSCGGGQ
ncbi:hypothetical protein OROHE_010004 [Orobanche hederae]